jgi:hypothetical protein
MAGRGVGVLECWSNAFFHHSVTSMLHHTVCWFSFVFTAVPAVPDRRYNFSNTRHCALRLRGFSLNSAAPGAIAFRCTHRKIAGRGRLSSGTSGSAAS